LSSDERAQVLRRANSDGSVFNVFRDDAEIFRAAPGIGGPIGLYVQPYFEKLADGGRSARHTLLEAPIVDGRQLLLVEHDLQPCFASKSVHGGAPEGAKLPVFKRL
jgi:hypothetical protein